MRARALALPGQGMQVDGKLANWPGAWKRDNIQFSPDTAINPQTIATSPNQHCIIGKATLPIGAVSRWSGQHLGLDKRLRLKLGLGLK